MSQTNKVNFQINGAIARIILDRPDKLNALDPEMLSALEDSLSRADESREVRVIILESIGHKAFCVGADILAWTALSPLEMWSEWVRRGHRIFDRLERARQPVICAIQGFALGGGLELALACDLRIAADTARFAMPEVKLGTVPGWGGTSRLPKLIGSSRAKQMIFTGEQISAETAERWGLVNEVVPADALRGRVTSNADTVCSNAPVAVQTAKQLIAEPAMAIFESLASATNAFTDDAKEGLASFREKRPPKFKGH
ncbi:MAG TPA: enoyl-CoA hydratase/isomerase family protein [Chthoniobacterales bacterium]|nr:enoyl-CoA hydratase/isomerase family protein [Chthoniobacterales bacterium]